MHSQNEPVTKHHEQSLESLGKDALSVVAKHLTPEDRSRLAKASVTLNKAVKTSYEVKLQLHFPEKYAELKKEEGIDWKKEFINTYKKVYKDVPQRVRDLFSVIKEQDIDALQGKFILPEDLYTKDGFGTELLTYVLKSGNVQLKEYVFGQLCGEYSNAKGLLLPDYHDNRNYTLLFWAIMLLQNPENISVLLARKSDINNLTKNTEWTAMHLAAQYNPQVIDVLAKRQPSLIEQQTKAGNTPLICAIASGTPAAAIKLLELGANPEKHSIFEDGITAVGGSNALHLAAKYGQTAVVELIMKSDINLDAHNFSDRRKQALHYAAENGNLEIVKMLVKKRISLILASTSDGYSPLTLAAENGHEDVVRYLLDATEDCLKHQYNDSIRNGIFKALYNAIENGQVNIIDMILPRIYKIMGFPNENVAESISAALSVAAKKNDLVSIKKIISYYPEIKDRNIYGRALIAAAKAGNSECLKYLIKNNEGAVNYKNAGGETTLAAAVQTGNTDMVKYLCNLGTGTKSAENVASNQDYNSALMLAVKQGNVEMVKTLLDKIVTIDPVEGGGQKRQAIHLAVGKFANMEIAKLILEKFPEQVNSKTATGVTTLELAIRYSNLELYKYLLSKGADISLKTKEGDNLRSYIKAQEPSMPKKTKEQMLALYDLKDYLQVRDNKNEFKKHFTLFGASFFSKPITILGRKFNFSKAEKIAAANAALDMVLNGKDKASLDGYKGELSNGALGSIAKRLRIR